MSHHHLTQSVDRAVRLLFALGEEPDGVSVSEVARRLELHKSTVSRLLATLEHHELVTQDAESEQFRLGPGFARLAATQEQDVALVPVLRPYLDSLARQTGETVNLAVLRGRDVFHLDQVDAGRYIASTNWAGGLSPVHATATGRVLMAFGPASVADAILAHDLPRMTDRTLTSAAELRRSLEVVRRVGHAVIVGELEEGLTAVAAPVFDGGGRVRAAVSVSGPSFRLVRARLPQVEADVAAAGRRCSEALGWSQGRSPLGAPTMARPAA
jgi:DNA-binding IclR family transcriptional regulator